MKTMDLTTPERTAIWALVTQELEYYYSNVSSIPVAPRLDQNEIRRFIQNEAGRAETSYEEKIRHVMQGLTQFSVHTSHPGYLGLYNPKANFAGIVADTITATFNPQLAAWSHAPFAVEVERYLISAFGQRFGYAENEIDGCFTTGGAEANLTAVICALNFHFPDYAERGLRALPAQPLIYCSQESHHSLVKAACLAGLGIDSVKTISTVEQKMDVSCLVTQVEEDQRNGFHPFLIVATMGSTGSGAIDSVAELQQIANRYHCWLHADAAYGGAVILNSNYRSLLSGIDRADSITFDAHKWLSSPMGTSLFITRHKDILAKTFRITADYMPKEASDLDIADPFTHSIQWSRRFIGLKLYLSVLFYGWEGLSDLVNRQIELGHYLRKQLIAKEWKIYNNTELPVVSFGNAALEMDQSLALRLCQTIINTGKAWLSVYPLNNYSLLRACLTNYNTSEKDIDQFVSLITDHMQELL
jgi:aromatic-L-amino-acid/L-tryptophan decarboxylase